MEKAISALTMVVVLFFSLAVALFVEELVFGALFRLWFGPPRSRPEMQEEKADCGR